MPLCWLVGLLTSWLIDCAASGAPCSLILKTGLSERAVAQWNSGRQEVAFYTQIATQMSAPLVPRCFDAVWDDDTNNGTCCWKIVSMR